MCIDFEKLSPKVQLSIQELTSSTKHCQKFVLNICLSYGSRKEIVQACQNIGKDLLNQRIQLTDITEQLFSQYLLSHEYPGTVLSTSTSNSLLSYIYMYMIDPDILIRTSGEYRISNYLLWQVTTTITTHFVVRSHSYSPPFIHTIDCLYRIILRR